MSMVYLSVWKHVVFARHHSLKKQHNFKALRVREDVPTDGVPGINEWCERNKKKERNGHVRWIQ
jgi:hypothetical protein